MGSDGDNGCATPHRAIVAVAATTPNNAAPLTEVANSSTPRTPVERFQETSQVVTPVTHASMDPLLHASTMTPPVSISPSTMDTPPVESHIHGCFVPEQFVPKEGMQFKEVEDAFEFYCDYAKMAGFNVRRFRKRQQASWYVCNREGFCDSSNIDKVTDKGSMRVGCKAEVKVKLDVKGKYWYFDIVSLKHNHALNPETRMVRFMRAHKNMEDGLENLMHVMTRAGVPHQAQMNVMSELHGGRENWMFTERDIKNSKALFARQEREDDIPKLLEFFRECKRANEYFYWDAQTDKGTGRIKNIFWSHASQRAECRDFGDVITFDTTHKTNTNKMPLALFVGANHQLQNVVFGQALLRDETADTFEWLFTTFKTCMGGHEPHVLLTDEDPAMKLAIPIVFQKTQHRYCRFHVTRTWRHDLDKLYATHKGLKVELESLFNFPLGPTEFEKAWDEVVEKYGIKEHAAIRSLWGKKEMWITTYFKGLYCGRMTSTQRSESTNRVMKDGFVNGMTSLHHFAEKMLEALQHMDHMEAGETHYSQAPSVQHCRAPFDDQLARLYTRKVYLEYRQTFNKSTAFRIDPNPDVEYGYLVKHQKGGGGFCWSNHAFRVHANVANGEYRCECRQWEHTGLFCMHLIKTFTHLQIRKIPSKYILKRYTREARSVVEWDRNDMVKGGRDGDMEQMRFAKLVPVVMGIARAGSKSEYAYEETLTRANTLRCLIETIPSNVATASNTEDGQTDVSEGNENALSLLAPPVSQTKGRGWKVGIHRNGTLQYAASTSTYKRRRTDDGTEIIGGRTCGHCNLKGHYATTCPSNPNRSRAAERKGMNRGGVRKRGRPRTRRYDSGDDNEAIAPNDIVAAGVDVVDDEE